MSRWRLFTGMSTGSQTVPPEWCNHGVAYASLTKFSKSTSDPYRRPPARSRTNGEPYAGANTTLSPPISTDRSGLRACCVNERGAVAHSARTCPGSKRTRSPSTVAPASLEEPDGDVVVDVHPDLGQDLVTLLLDQRQSFLAEQLVVRDLATDERRRSRVRVGIRT